MPFFLLIAGIILIVAAYRKKHEDLFKLLKDDFFGKDNFIIWTLAIVCIVSLGYIKQIKPVTDAFLVLIVLVIIVKNYRDNKDILTMFIDQIKGNTGGSGGGNGAVNRMLSGLGFSANSALSRARNELEGILK